MVADVPLDRSYRALLGVPRLGRIILSGQVARVAQSMVGVAVVLFVLAEYNSPALAGLVTFASVFPGLLVSPIAGALLDRHGRTRLIILDYLIALAALVLIGTLSLAGALSVPLLLLIAIVSSLTAILSHTGLRSLFPIIVPRHLWERVNAVDSNGYVVATILGPPIAAGMVALVGGATALIIIGSSYGFAVLVLIGVEDPETETASTGRLLLDAWQGMLYTWHNRTLRGLGLSSSLFGLACGMSPIVVPLIVLERLRAGEFAVGLVFAMSGVMGMGSAFLFGRMDTRRREWMLLVLPMVATAPAVALLLVPASTQDVVLGLTMAALSFAWIGFLNGPMDIALFTVRQRRTDPAWMGRAFAVSMALNSLGFPVGAALAGSIAAVSLEAAILLGVGACLLGAALAAILIPRE
jgi:predicted MFS family arabinose efflux permease